MASNITVSGLVVAPGVQQTYAQWAVDDPNINGLPYLQLDRVELWASTTNDRSTASKVAEGVTFANYVYAGFDKRYHWIRARDREGQYGDWYPSGATSGVVDSAVWQDYTATVEPTSGAFTTHTVVRSVYYKIGPNVTFNVLVGVSDNGTGADMVEFTLPIAPQFTTPIAGTSGLDSDFKGLAALVYSAGLGVAVLYDGTYPVWTTPCVLSFAGTYEADE